MFRLMQEVKTALVEMSKHLHRDRKYLASLLCFLDISADFDTVLYTYPFYSNPRTVMHLPYPLMKLVMVSCEKRAL